MVVTRVAHAVESIFGAAWSAGEVALALSRFDEVRGDPYRAALLDDIATRGFYVPIDPEEVALRIDARGRIDGRNPYRRVAPHDPERVIAKLVPSRVGPTRHLVVVCHCYGVPRPGVMERLFGLRGIAADVAYNVMVHHQPGSYPLWAGSGFTRVRVSRFVENVRSAVTGARALVAGLVHARGYDRVTVIGFSIGGQLALHLATAERLAGAVLYCPLTSFHVTARELGVMPLLVGPLRLAVSAIGKADPLDGLSVTEPLRYPMRTDPRAVHVIVQERDVLAPPRQIEAIRAKYPQVHWHAFGGTHLYPASLRALRGVVRGAIERAA